MIIPPKEEGPKAVTRPDSNLSNTNTGGQKVKNILEIKEKRDPDPIDALKKKSVYVVEKNDNPRIRLERDFGTNKFYFYSVVDEINLLIRKLFSEDFGETSIF